MGELKPLERGGERLLCRDRNAVPLSRLIDRPRLHSDRLDMGEVTHQSEPGARQPVDRAETVIRRRPEGLSFPNDVTELQVGAVRLRKMEAAPRSLGGAAISAELEIGSFIASGGLAPYRRKGEKGEVGGSRKNVEGKAQPHLTTDGRHRHGQ